MKTRKSIPEGTVLKAGIEAIETCMVSEWALKVATHLIFVDPGYRTVAEAILVLHQAHSDDLSVALLLQALNEHSRDDWQTLVLGLPPSTGWPEVADNLMEGHITLEQNKRASAIMADRSLSSSQRAEKFRELADFGHSLRNLAKDVFVHEEFGEKISDGLPKPDIITDVTGIPEIDACGLRLFPEKILTVSAPTGDGKSSFTGYVAARAAANGKEVIILSGEMPADEYGDRLCAAASGVREMWGADGYTTELDPFGNDKGVQEEPLETYDGGALLDLWREGKTWISDLPISFHKFRSGAHVGELVGKVMFAHAEVKKRRGEGWTGEFLIVCDYLGLVSSDQDKIYERVEEISNAMQACAGRIGASLIMVQQQNRSQGKDNNKLMGGGGSANNSHYIIMIESKEAEDFDGNPYQQTLMHVTKTRRGRKTKQVPVGFDGQFHTWTDFRTYAAELERRGYNFEGRGLTVEQVTELSKADGAKHVDKASWNG